MGSAGQKTDLPMHEVPENFFVTRIGSLSSRVSVCGQWEVNGT